MPDTISLESLRAKLAAGEIRGVAEPTLGGYFLRMYGPEGSGEPAAARDVPDSVAVSVAVAVAVAVAVSVPVSWPETLRDPGQRPLTPVSGL